MTREKLAEVCHEVNRAYCLALGDKSQAPWGDAPAWQKDSARNGVAYHLDFTGETSPEHSHRNWMVQKFGEGWTYGPEKDVEGKRHPCLVPFAELPVDQRAKDYIFHAIVQACRSEVAGSP